MNLDELIGEYAEIEGKLADPAVHADQNLARRLGKRYAQLRPIVETARLVFPGDQDAKRGFPRVFLLAGKAD